MPGMGMFTMPMIANYLVNHFLFAYCE